MVMCVAIAFLCVRIPRCPQLPLPRHSPTSPLAPLLSPIQRRVHTPARRVRRRVGVGNSGRFTITANFQDSDCPQTLANTDGKEIITKHPRSVTAEFGVNYKMMTTAILSGEIPDDVKTLLQQLMDLC